MKYIYTAFLFIAFFSTYTKASELPPPAMDAIKDVCSKPSIYPNGIAIGQLYGNPLPEIAILIDCSPDKTQEIIILKNNDNERYSIIEHTHSWPFNPLRWDSINIKNNTLIYSQGCAGDCEESWASEFKFKKLKDSLILIGRETRFFDSASDGAASKVDPTNDSFGTSINFITRKAIFWRKSKKRSADKSLNFKLDALIGFSDFDYDSADDLNIKIKGLNGHFDKNFQFHP